MKIYLIAAMSINYVIGSVGKQPWDIPKDWEYFQQKTFGQFVIIGRITNETMPVANANNWKKIILSNKSNEVSDGIVFNNLDSAIKYCKERKQKKVFILGGQAIFEESIIFADKIFLTIIEKEIQGDRFFPLIDLQKWHKTKQSKKYKNALDSLTYSFTEWERI